MTAAEGGRPPERRLLDLLGLAARAGRIVSGTDAVRQGVRDGEVVLAVLAADASPTQLAKLIPLLEARKIGHPCLLSREQLGSAIGRGPVTAVGLTDRGFARQALALIEALPVSPDRV